MTICAPATTTGGAIGIIRVSGPHAIIIVNSLFSKDISDAPGYTVHYGTIFDSAHEVIDEVIISVFRTPHSYTGEDSVEISHHGSSYVQRTILNLLMTNGCRMALPGEFTQRAYLNGKMDLTQAEAVADLISSDSSASHRVAFNQMRGGISSKLSELKDELLKLTSLLELELDFSDHEDLEFADRTELIRIAEAVSTEIKRLTSSFSQGNAIKNGIPVAIIGAPNVGKSTLLNQLLQDDRAIVSDIKGTTRDIIDDVIEIDGVKYRFIDTAGIRKTDDTIELLGIERSIKAAEKAHVIIMMAEPGVPYPNINVSEEQVVIRIMNKSDEFQAKTGIGIDWLKSELRKSIPPISNDHILITNLRHKQVLDTALIDINRALEALSIDISGDLVAEDLRQCLAHLSEILGGQITSDDVLSNIFKHFCIGK